MMSLRVDYVFNFSHKLTEWNFERSCQLDNGFEAGLSFASFYPADELAIDAGLPTQLFL